MLRDKLGRVIAQGDVLARVGIDPYRSPFLALACVVDGCSFALKLKLLEKGEDGHLVVSDASHMIIVKRKGWE